MFITKFRLGILLGFALGYVLGTRAGRERYESIQAAWSKVRRSDPGQTLEYEVRTAAERAASKVETAVDEQVQSVTETVKEKAGIADQDTAGAATTPANGTVPPPSIQPPPTV